MEGRKPHAFLVQQAKGESLAEFKVRMDKMLALERVELARQSSQKLNVIYAAMLEKALSEPSKFSTPRAQPLQEDDNPVHAFHEELCKDLLELDPELKKDLSRLIDFEPFSTLCHNMLQDLYCHPDALYFFIGNWFSVFKSAQEIVGACDHIEELLIETLFKEHLSFVHKLACIHILELECELASQNTVSAFLQKHRNKVWMGGFGNTKSTDIFIALRTGKKSEAEALLTAEKAKFKTEFKGRVQQETVVPQLTNKP